MTKTTIEIGANETVTCAMTLPLPDNGEHYGPPLVIGYYPGQAEIWIDVGERLNIQLEHVEAFIKQLRRAARTARAHAPPGATDA